MRKLLVLVLALFSLLPVNAKRKAPKNVEPLVVDGIRYEATWRPVKGSHKAAFVRAVSAKTQEEIWLLQIYETSYKQTRA